MHLCSSDTTRITGGTGSSQKQQGQVALDMARWKEASTRTYTTETKSTWHHRHPVLLLPKAWMPHHTRKTRFRFNINLIMITEDFRKEINNSLKEIQKNHRKTGRSTSTGNRKIP